MIPYYTAAKNFSTGAAIASTTAITAAKWNMVMGSNDCSAVLAASANGITTATCLASSYSLVLATATSTSWFQPKEISTKVYTTLTRFSAKESATWTGMVAADSKKSASGCAAKTLTGASALVASAAVAFGAAALAF